MRKMALPICILLGLLAAGKHTLAQQRSTSTAPIKFLIRAGLEMGGEKVATVYYTNGNEQGVRAGQGISIGAGIQAHIPGAERLVLQGTVGYKYVTTAANNAHIRLTRVPIIVTGSYFATQKLRFGAGVATHQAIKFNGGGLGGNMNFKSATGPTFEVAYSGIGLSYTAMSYKDQHNQSYNAGAIGITASITFPSN